MFAGTRFQSCVWIDCSVDQRLYVSAGHRSAPAVALRKGKSNWLFDCGEDTQRQLLKQALVRPGKIDRIFVTRASGDSAFGLPGMRRLIHHLSNCCTECIHCCYGFLVPNWQYGYVAVRLCNAVAWG